MMTETLWIENKGASTMRSFRYGNTVRRNANFDGDAFIRSWARFVGSTHRHHETLELVLFWSINGPHPQERDTLRARLEPAAVEPS